MQMIKNLVLLMAFFLMDGCDQSTPKSQQNLDIKLQPLEEQVEKFAKEREQLKLNCHSNRVLQKAKHDKLLAVGKYWEAADAIRECAETLEDKTLSKLVATAEKKHYTTELNSSKSSAQHKANVIEMMIRYYPEDGKKYEGKLAQLNEKATAEYKEEQAKLIAKDRAEDAKGRKSKGVIIGMTTAEVIASNWGKPNSINQTTSANMHREQWVYGIGVYLYFENGVLTLVQN